MQMERIGGRVCRLYVPEGPGPWPLAVVCGGGLEALAAGRPRAVLLSLEAEGGRDFTPWPAPGLGEEAFAGQAGRYLEELLGRALPEAARHAPLSGRQAILGYSLGGLFALWARLQGAPFARVASLSGSLWYDGWLDYLAAHLPAPGPEVYLSLGKAEEHGGPRRMRAVGDATRATAAHLSGALGEGAVTLAWNRGGHFTGIPTRWQRGLAWALDGWQ